MQTIAGRTHSLEHSFPCERHRLRGTSSGSKKEEKGWHGQIAATRKVTPGFRHVEKYAVIVGGGVPHRMTLSDMTMLKDNHVWACGGSIADMVKKARTACGFSNKIEVECQSQEEAMEAAGAGAEVVIWTTSLLSSVRLPPRI